MNEEEVIERLNRYKTIKVLYGNTFAIHLEQLEQLQNDIETVLNLLEKKDKVINEYEKECRQFKAFCKRVRRYKKHDVDLFNQGQEHKCNQFLNLISGEPHWSYEGKYFDDTDNQIKQCFENKAEEENRYVKNKR